MNILVAKMRSELILLILCVSGITAQINYNIGRECGAAEADEDCDSLEELLSVNATKDLDEKALISRVYNLGETMGNLICKHETLATYEYTRDRYELIWTDIYRMFVELFLKMFKNREASVENRLHVKVGEIMGWYRSAIENLESSQALLATRGVKSAVTGDLKFIEICTDLFFKFLNSYGKIAAAFLT